MISGRVAVNPLRCAVLASRKPAAAVIGRPSNACVRPLAAADKTSLFCTLRPTNMGAEAVVPTKFAAVSRE